VWTLKVNTNEKLITNCLYLLLILTDLRVLERPWILAIGGNEKCVLKTRDIPTLTNPSPPPHQRGFRSPLSAIAKIISKYAGICVLLLFFLCCCWFNLTSRSYNALNLRDLENCWTLPGHGRVFWPNDIGASVQSVEPQGVFAGISFGNLYVDRTGWYWRWQLATGPSCGAHRRPRNAYR